MPEGKTVSVRPGVTVLAAARQSGVHIPTRCGGKMGCLMCKVKLTEEESSHVLPPKEEERRKLGTLIDEGIRFSCQTVVHDHVQVEVPEDPLKAAVRRQLESARNRDREDFI
ncbi:ferredoxin [Paenibacillus algicola]|uniref:Ferredoxin n=1 Tax=Paenibacillus algicola TaxID=2565926 RepID=A0A4P8XIV6_9BACL|nr:2Fe-2S iron-sulfur cluster-binding protein [Paenibacillus algicola]QCT02552.1 ferredoxin [Paenibacillus algicola]